MTASGTAVPIGDLERHGEEIGWCQFKEPVGESSLFRTASEWSGTEAPSIMDDVKAYEIPSKIEDFLMKKWILRCFARFPFPHRPRRI